MSPVKYEQLPAKIFTKTVLIYTDADLTQFFALKIQNLSLLKIPLFVCNLILSIRISHLSYLSKIKKL